jgi:hypothetical protein
MVFRRQIQLLADTVVFRKGRLFKGAVLALEYAAGVSEGLVKKELIEVVSQVVMGSDVEATSFSGVTARPFSIPSNTSRFRMVIRTTVVKSSVDHWPTMKASLAPTLPPNTTEL